MKKLIITINALLFFILLGLAFIPFFFELPFHFYFLLIIFSIGLLVLVNIILYINLPLKYRKLDNLKIFFYILIGLLLPLSAALVISGMIDHFVLLKTFSSLVVIDILITIILAYIINYHSFGKSKELSELRLGGLAINPQNKVGKLIYGFIFFIILIVLLKILLS